MLCDFATPSTADLRHAEQQRSRETHGDCFAAFFEIANYEAQQYRLFINTSNV